MGKNKSASGLINVINYDNFGNISFVSGSTTLMQVSSSGAITTTGVISGSSVESASLAQNSNLLQGTGSVGFTTTGSFTTMSSSLSSRTTQIENVYATTGSNSFRATQSITGSLTVTGQIIAQTINVQQVTSSIIYSSGSNVFGCDINSRQTFTGSFYQTGSVAYFSNNVGIGTISPFNFGTGHKTLDVRGDGVSSIGALFVGNCDRSVVLGVYINPAAGGTVGTSTNHYLQLVTCDVERVKITSNGLVGINCNDPKYTLDVNGLANINAVATTNQGTVQSLRVSSNTGNSAVTINSMSINNFSYLTFAQGCAAKFEIGVASCGDPSYPSSLYINNNTQVGSANAAIRIASSGITSFQCQVCVPSMTALTARTSGTDVNILTLADNVTGTQTSGFGVRIVGASNGGNARSAIAFEADGGTNNDTAISFYTQASAACLAHRMIIDKSGLVAIGSKSTVAGIKLLVCGGGDYNALFTSDTNRSGWVIAQPGTSSPVASGLVLSGSCSFRFGTNSYYHIAMNQDGATQVFNTGGNATNTFMPSGLLCTLCGIRFGTGATTLNNYETGTWTPRFGDGSWLTNAGPDNSGWYIRIGNMVTVGGTLNWSGGSGTQANDLRIRCFPFAASNGTNERNVGQFGAPGASSIGFRCGTNSQMVLVTDPGQSSSYVIEAYQSGTFLTYTHSPCVANTGIIYGFQITYHI